MGSADLSFGVLSTELWSLQGALARALRPTAGSVGAASCRSAATTLASARDWLEATFASDAARGLLAPWVLHTGLGPEQAVSGFMTQVIGCAIQLGGMPVPRGGGIRLVEALAAIVREAAASCGPMPTSSGSSSSGGRATGVQLVGGETVTRDTRRDRQRHADAAVRHAARPRGARRLEAAQAAEAFRYGRADMQIHLALSEPPVWASGEAERLARTAIVHVTPGLDGVSRAVNEAERGLLPAEATIVVGQPCAVDPCRAPDGSWILWIQLQELPRTPRGDALGEHRRRRRDVDGRAPRRLRRPHHRSARGDRSATSSERRSSASCSRRPTSRR